jgi:predicted nucleic acid-binding protein
MVYLALAERLSASFVTADQRLLARVGHLPYVVPVG